MFWDPYFYLYVAMLLGAEVGLWLVATCRRRPSFAYCGRCDARLGIGNDVQCPSCQEPLTKTGVRLAPARVAYKQFGVGLLLILLGVSWLLLCRPLGHVDLKDLVRLVLASLASVLAIPVLLMARYAMRTSRQLVGTDPTCGSCGYNLTNLTSDRCPECGKKFVEAGVTIGRRNAGWANAARVFVAAFLIMVFIFSIFVVIVSINSKMR